LLQRIPGLAWSRARRRRTHPASPNGMADGPVVIGHSNIELTILLGR